MFKLLRWVRVGLAVTSVMLLTTGSLFADETSQERGDQPNRPPASGQPPAPSQEPAANQPPAAPEGAACFERYVAAPVDEKGIQCPGEPAIWKSYTYASDGFGYYTETDNYGGVPFTVRLGYVHQDGRVAIMIMDCNPECEVHTWNGVDFPFGH